MPDNWAIVYSLPCKCLRLTPATSTHRAPCCRWTWRAPWTGTPLLRRSPWTSNTTRRPRLSGCTVSAGTPFRDRMLQCYFNHHLKIKRAHWKLWKDGEIHQPHRGTVSKYISLAVIYVKWHLGIFYLYCMNSRVDRHYVTHSGSRLQWEFCVDF